MKPQLSLFPEKQPGFVDTGTGTAARPAKTPHGNTFAARKRRAGYRKATHPLQRCRQCKYLRKKSHGRRNYYKCELIGLSDSEATDIRLSYVCRRFEEAG